MSSEWKWLARQTRPVLPLLILNLVFIVVGSALTLLDPLVIRWLIDVALPERDLRLVLLGTLVFCAVYLVSVIVSYLASFISCVVSQKLIFQIRISLLRRIQTLGAKYHGNSKVGEMLYRIEQDVDRVAELGGDILPLAIQMVIMGLMVLVTMGVLNWHLTLVVAPLLPLFYVLQHRCAISLKDAADNVQNQSGKISSFLQEHLASMLQLQLLNRTNTRGRKFARLAAEGARFQINQRATEMSFSVASISVIVLGMGAILGYGGYEVTRSTLTVGGLVAFYGYVFRLFVPVSVAIDLQARLQRVGASIRRIQEIAKDNPQIVRRECMRPLRCDTKPELEFRSVWFCYSAEKPVLRDMSFRVDAGETVAVVGLNGSGKSTIGLLATRLFDSDAGKILVGGQDIQRVGRRSLRALLTLVPQEPILFDGTVRENLLYGNPRATEKDLETVSALTQLDRVLLKLPKGLDEPLGPSGGRLSGGEKKRLALARSLLQQPRILIVDEITSALDGPAAAGLLQGLELFCQARTLVVISHRPATILWANRILVVANGAIADSGKHDEMILRCQAYQRIWECQDRVPSIRSQPVLGTSGTTESAEISAS
ncbi:MAG: Methionine transporter ATP-binding protein [Edaphobacter sp.]|nr:Methionine transporter ATP-binding protein [Edaphobacter sp.]